MKKLVLLLLFILIACVQPSLPASKPVFEEKAPEMNVSPVKSFEKDVVMRTVEQEGSLGKVSYGLTDDNRLVKIEKTGSVWEFKYERGRLAEISGPEPVEFLYENNKLSAIDTGARKLLFKYDSRGRLVEVKGGQETLYFEYDSLDQIRGVRRGVAGETSIDYYKDGRVKYLTRGPITTNVYYDDKGRVRNFDADDTKMILGYWRDDRLISLTGKTFGRGLAVSYGPDVPAREAKVVYESDDSVFKAAYTDTLYSVVDRYVYCKYVRRLKDVLFEGISYSIYVNYFKGDIVGYLMMQFACVPYES